MAITLNIPVEEYTSLVECRAKLAIIENYVRSGNACYRDDEFLKCILGMKEGSEDVRTD